MCHFIYENESCGRPYILSNVLVSFGKISWSHQFLHVGWFISQNRCSHALSQGLYGTDNLWYFLRIATFSEELSYAFDFLRVHSLLISPLQLQQSFVWSMISAFVRKRVAVIHFLKDTIFILTGDLPVIHFLSNSFSNSMFVSQKTRFQLCVLSEIL